jgi:uncharacterized delta-60 repeat protein
MPSIQSGSGRFPFFDRLKDKYVVGDRWVRPSRPLSRRNHVGRILLEWAGTEVASGTVPASGSAGTLDTSFGNGGFSIVYPATAGAINSVAIQPDGKIVAAGYSINNSAQLTFMVIRYLSNGSLDTSFGTGGFVLLTPGTGDQLFSVLIQNDGKIVAGGQASQTKFALARYSSSGSLDLTFGTGGFSVLTFSAVSVIQSIALASTTLRVPPVGAIVFGGYSTGTGGRDIFTLGRCLSNGTLDASFATSGYNTSTPATSNNDIIYSIVVRPDTTILAGGVSHGATTNKFALARYLSTGGIDNTFGTSGFSLVTPGVSDSIASIALQVDGKIVVGGLAQTVASAPDTLFGLGRYLAGGGADTSFGTSGFNLSTPTSGDNIASVAIRPDGKIVVGGSAGGVGFAVARYNTNGSLDTSFGTAGYNLTTPGTIQDMITSIALQADGKIVAGGFSLDAGGNSWPVIARYFD